LAERKTVDRWLLGGAPLPEARIALKAGPVTAELEPTTGFLRYLQLGEHELLRGVYAAVRDHNWDTVTPRIGELETRIEADHFEVRFVAECVGGDLELRWEGLVQGQPDGTVTYRFSGEALSAFQANRIGFCVLHPVGELPGRPCRIEQVDGEIVEGRFPESVAPHQPYKEIRAITHEVVPGTSVEVRMSGETFEMEDQRNWTDASYKTYCRPLEKPFPFEVEAGDWIEQEVRIRLLGPPKARPQSRGEAPVTLELVEAPRARPTVGLGQASDDAPLSKTEVDRLKLLQLAHLRVDLSLRDPGFPDRLERADETAGAIGTKLELALHVTDDAEAELRKLAWRLADLHAGIARILLFHASEKSTSAKWGRLAERILGPLASEVPMGLGTDAFFADLNQRRPDPEVGDCVTYSINPQVHAFDEASIVETLQGQAMTVETAKGFTGERSAVVSPVTLRMRFNPNATGPEPPTPAGELPPQVDPRQMSLFTAAWTVGSIGALAEGGVASVTYYETTGWRGVMERQGGSPLPERFPSTPGAVFPVFHALADVNEWPVAQLLPLRSSRPLGAQGLAVRHGGRYRILVANLEPGDQRVRCVGLPGGRSYRMRSLDLASVEEATTAPERFRRGFGDTVGPTREGELELELAPYGVVTLEEGDRAPRDQGTRRGG
jgi:hypothetical protein